MTDVQSPPSGTDTETRILAIIAYVFFIGVFAAGLGTIVGVVLAYVKRDEARGTIWESHFDNLIHVFWTGVAVFVVFCAIAALGIFGVLRTVETNQFAGAVLLLPVLYVASIAYLVWYLYRVVKGLMRALENKPYS